MSINKESENEPVTSHAPINEEEPSHLKESGQTKNKSTNNIASSAKPSHTSSLPAKRKSKKSFKKASLTVAICFIISILGGILGGGLYNYIFPTTSSGSTSTTDSTSSTKVDSSTTLSSADVVKLVADSVVDISTESSTKSADNKTYVSISAGSGVVYSSDGYIITNEHVINGNNQITVTLKDDTKYSATLVGSDATNDIALLKINANNLSPVVFGNSDNLEVGEATIVIGNPLGELSGTVTEGVVSAVNREVTVEGHNMSLLQTSAEINSGNSGGGVFRLTGELIGIVIAKSSGDDIEGLGFAIPSNTVKTVVENLKK